jgi:hypothetical protein
MRLLILDLLERKSGHAPLVLPIDSVRHHKSQLLSCQQSW